MLLRIILIGLICLPFSSAFAVTQFRIIIDASGSMLISDPDRLTSESLKLIADLAPDEETTLGVWLFGEKPRVLLPETPITPEIKRRLKSNLGGYVTEDVQTDLEAALTQMLSTPAPTSSGEEASRHWILVTDGMVDVSLDDAVNDASRQQILDSVLGKLVEQDIHLHTISMSNYTDEELLKSLSANTNAIHTEVAVPGDLLTTFDRIFTAANQPDEIPFVGDTFLVDRSIDEFTLLIFHAESGNPVVYRPDQQVLPLVDSPLMENDKVSIARNKFYTLVTVREPDAGEWRVENADTEKSSIRVVTNLTAEASIVPSVLFLNETLLSDIALFENGEALQDNRVLDVLKVMQALIRYKGAEKEVANLKRLTHDAYRFKNQFAPFTDEGDYELYTELDGKSFMRKLSQAFSIIPAIKLEVAPKDHGLIAFTIKPTHLRLNTYRSRVMLEIIYQSGERLFEEMPLLGIGFWQRIIIPKAESFSVRAKIDAVTRTGAKFEYWTPYWRARKRNTQEGGKIITPPSDLAVDKMSATKESLNQLENQSVASEPEQVEETQSVTAPVVLPSIQVEPAIQTEPEPAPEVESTQAEQLPIEEDASIEETDAPTEPEGLVSSGGILLYVLANSLILLAFGGGLWWYLRRKKG